MSKYKHAYLRDFIEEYYKKTKEQLTTELQEKDPVLLKEVRKLLKKQIQDHLIQCETYKALAAGIYTSGIKLERPEKVINEFIKMGSDFEHYNLAEFPLNTVKEELKQTTANLMAEIHLINQKGALFDVIDSFLKPKSTCCFLFWKREDKSKNDVKETVKPGLSV